MTQESKEKIMNTLHKVDLDTFTVRDMARTINANTDVLDELTKGMSGSIDTLISEVEEVSSQLEQIEYQVDNSPKDYNAVINNILSRNENVIITFKEGIHEIEKIVIDNKHNFKIKAKKGAILKLKDNSNNSLIWIKDNCSNISIENIVIDGNKNNQTHISNKTTPFANNTALLLIQSHNTQLNNICIENSRITALICCAYSDGYEYRKGIILNNITVNNCYGGVECIFCKSPILSNINCINIGGEFVEIVDVSSTNITLSKNIVHNHNNYIGIYDAKYDVVARIEKTSQINNSNIVAYSKIEGLAELGSGYKVFEIKQLSNGIILNHCDFGIISNCCVENTTLMGIGVINTTKQSTIENCKAINCAEEGICLDGTINSKVVNCYTYKSATCSDAPSIHIANVSPGISKAYNNIIENNIIEDCFYVGISSGLTANNTTLRRNLIKGNILTNNLNIDNSIGILSSYSSIEDNTINYFNIGIQYVLGGKPYPIKNNNLRGKDNKGIGIDLVNVAHLPIMNNNIVEFGVGVFNGVQGGNKIVNNYIECDYALDVNNLPSSTYFNNNFGNLKFKNGIPQITNSNATNTITNLFDSELERSNYNSTISLDYNNRYILKVYADGAHQYPSSKVYLCYFNSLILLSDKTTDKQVIDVNAEKSSNKINITVAGNGGGKAIQYTYVPLI